MTRLEAETEITKELATASQARSSKNEGMVRVCARRAAGHAIRFWLSSHPSKSWGYNAVQHLRHLADDLDHPEEVRNAARRLTTRITTGFQSPHAEDPIDDSTIIIRWFMQ